MIPPLLNDFIGLQKDTVLVSIIGVVEIFRQAQIIKSATFNFTPYLAVALVFIVITIPMARFTDWLVERDRAARPRWGSDERAPGPLRPASPAGARHRGPAQVVRRPRGPRGIDLSIDSHEVVCLIGSSGSGKSTLLRCINLLEPIDAGRIVVDGDEITAKGVDVNRIRRRIGIVFQAFNLFPHMSVIDNVTLAPRKVLGLSTADAEARAMELLERIGLADKRDDYPDRLSGGQQQRVAIVRALAMQPDLLLLDEITSALDPELVAEVLALIRELAGVRDDDAHRDPRDGLRPRHRQPGLFHRRGPDPRVRARRPSCSRRPARSGPGGSSSGSSTPDGCDGGCRPAAARRDQGTSSSDSVTSWKPFRSRSWTIRGSASSVFQPPSWSRTIEPPWARATTVAWMSSAVGPPSAVGTPSFGSTSHSTR